MEWITSKLASWASILDPKTRSQACDIAALDIVQPHAAMMPDGHLGKGAAIGMVIPTLRSIIPAAVGVDIGCGMIAVRTQWNIRDFENGDLQHLQAEISKAIPLSAGHYNSTLLYSHTRKYVSELERMPGIDQAEEASPKVSWTRQLGSLGSGNHFIEISSDENGNVWLFLHSGSRGVGNRIAQKHIRIARDVCNGPRPNNDLSWLTEGTGEFDCYIEGLRWAQRFAYLNREEMMDRVKSVVAEFMGEGVMAYQEVNCHHNYTERCSVLDRDGKSLGVWLSRKGAIDASAEVWGLIPGSMGTASYVVQGKGNPLSHWSSPHGAGRNFSRSAARKQFTFADLKERMQGIAWGQSAEFLDEHPDAYKDIDTVMEDAATLVTPVHQLRQFVNVKGD